jgi:tetratricopeptide (TPR) repeat protein
MSETGERSELKAGDEVAGAYRVREQLGRGGMGEVVEVEHLRTHRRLALKTLRHGAGGRVEESRARFRREAHAMSLLAHPHIVQVEDFGELADGAPYLVMELAGGQSLKELLAAGDIPPARAYGITRQILDALGYAHAQGVVHRDLKPDNIKVIPDGDGGDRVKILDFGIAKLVGEASAAREAETLTQVGVAFGTPDYMAPEQALGQKVDGRADLYALGVILFEMLAGRLPFEAEEAISVARMHVAVDPPTLAQAAPGRRFTPEAEALVAKALGKRPAERFADAAEMAAAVIAAEAADLVPKLRAATPLPGSLRLADAATPAPTVVRAARVRRPWTRRQRVGAGVAAAVVLVLGLAAALSAGGRGGSGGGAGLAGLPGRAASAAPPPASALADEAGKLLDGGDARGAAALLERELAKKAHAGDARAHAVLGHARLALGKPSEAVAAYELALALAPGIARDSRYATNLVDLASRGKTFAVRQKAGVLSERAGLEDRVDRVDRLSLDLAQAPSCPERREALLGLRAIGDTRALPAVKKAKHRRSGFFGTGRPNGCLEKDAAELIEAWEAKGSGSGSGLVPVPVPDLAD